LTASSTVASGAMVTQLRVMTSAAIIGSPFR
jgi:hypothetical protein